MIAGLMRSSTKGFIDEKLLYRHVNPRFNESLLRWTIIKRIFGEELSDELKERIVNGIDYEDLKDAYDQSQDWDNFYRHFLRDLKLAFPERFSDAFLLYTPSFWEKARKNLEESKRPELYAIRASDYSIIQADHAAIGPDGIQLTFYSESTLSTGPMPKVREF